MNPHLVGIAWYAGEDYDGILEIMTDSDLMPETFDEWLERANETEGQLRAHGFRILHVALRPEAFVSWCRASNVEADAAARSRYAAEAAEQAEADNPPIRVDLPRV